MSERQNNIDPRYINTGKKQETTDGGQGETRRAKPGFPTIGRRPITEYDVDRQHREEARKWE